MLKNKKSLQEQIDRIKYVTKYTINETPKYKSLVGNSGIDVLPEYLMKEAGKPEDVAPDADPTAAPAPAAPVDANAAPSPEPSPDGASPQPSPDAASAMPSPDAGGGAPAPAPAAAPAAPTPSSNTNVDITTADAPSTQPDPSMDGSGMDAPVEPAPDAAKRAMELQLNALRMMSDKIEDLGATIDSLNQRMAVYSAEVDKVREPSDMEKFENRKVDSSPYYFNLNDLWQDNNFKSRMDQFSKGYVKTEDGYVADFDDLPKLSPHEVKASFDGI